MFEPTIFFFGGYLASSADVNAWATSVTKKTNLPVHAFAYPAGATAGNPLSVWDQHNDMGDLLELMNEVAIIVGHSSGCQIANEVCKRANAVGKETYLICLDGFLPPTSLGGEVWSAECEGVQSLNYQALRHDPRFRVYKAGVRSRWPLHFSLLNLNASDEHTAITDGYRNCDANLEILKEALVF